MTRSAVPSNGLVRIGGVVGAKDRFLNEIESILRDSGAAHGPLFGWPRAQDLGQRLREAARLVAERCERQGIDPSDLASPSRRAFQLLTFLAVEHNFEAHLETLARLVLAAGRDGRLKIRLDHVGSLYRIERGPESIRLVVSEGFVGAPESVLGALARLAIPYARKREPRRAVREYTEGSRFAETLRLVEAAGGANRSRPTGVVYDLGELFDRVNRQYFAGRLSSPRLLWSERVPSVEFGHFEPATDTVRLSRRLDSPDVPDYVLEHVMHHELLHRVLGAERQGGTRRYHSARFRREERDFARFEEAEAVLRRIARE